MRSEQIKSVIVATARPSGPGDLGQCAEGFYFVENGVLTMCTPDSRPFRDDDTGRQVATRLLAGDDERVEARKLTLRRHRAANKDEMVGFHRPIRYRHSGLS